MCSSSIFIHLIFSSIVWVGINGAKNVCTTPGCLEAAAEFLKAIDTTVEPCDNFYRFACGGFLKNTHIPHDQYEVGRGSVLTNKVQKQLRNILEKKSTSADPKSFKVVKNLYKACMNSAAIEAQSRKQLLKDLKKLGGWPVLESDHWNEENFSWTELTYKMRNLGYPYNNFLTVGVEVDPKNNTKLRLYMEELSSLGEDLTDKGYRDYMIDIAVMLGAERKLAKEEMASAFQFLADLDEVGLISNEYNNERLMTIAELSQLYPNIPWKNYVNHLLPSSVQVDDSDVITVKVPDYIPNFLDLMEKTPKRVQANYAIWRAVADSVSYMNNEIKSRGFQWSAGESEIKNNKLRWDECVTIVSKKFKLIMGAMYVRRYFRKETKRYTLEIANAIRNRAHEILQNADWLDDETKRLALQKSLSIDNQIAYPDEFFDNRKLEAYYKGLILKDDNYLQGILNITLFDTEKTFSQLRAPFNRSDWSFYENTITVNAYYSNVQNAIVIPAAILQGSFFGSDRPKYLNYGAIGNIIGHEIIHALQYQADWWAPDTAEVYHTKAQCLIDQYGNYSVESVQMRVDGESTEVKNVADNGGLKAAYLAYKEWSAHNEPEQMLPGLPYTPNQMFWISLANVRCAVQQPDVLFNMVVYDEHSPPEFRVIGTLSNHPDFSKDFQCSTDSKMNPKKKCGVW